MTNMRITSEGVTDWLFCPYCGDKLHTHQGTSHIEWDDDGIDVEATEATGFDFAEAYKSCGVHIRLWVPVDGTEAIE